MSEELFLDIIADAVSGVRRRVQIAEKRTQVTDHRMLPGVPATDYLKRVIGHQRPCRLHTATSDGTAGTHGITLSTEDSELVSARSIAPLA